MEYLYYLWTALKAASIYNGTSYFIGDVAQRAVSINEISILFMDGP